MFDRDKQIGFDREGVNGFDGRLDMECACAVTVNNVYDNISTYVRCKLQRLTDDELISLLHSWCDYNSMTYELTEVVALLDLFFGGAPLSRLVSNIHCFLSVCDDCSIWDSSTRSFHLGKFHYKEEDRRVSLLLRFRDIMNEGELDRNVLEEGQDYSGSTDSDLTFMSPVSVSVISDLRDLDAIGRAVDSALTYCLKEIKNGPLFPDSLSLFREVVGYPLLFLVLSKIHWLSVLTVAIVEEQLDNCFVSFCDMSPISDAFIIQDDVVRAPIFKGLDDGYYQCKVFYPRLSLMLNKIFDETMKYMVSLFSDSYWKVCPVTEIFKNKIKSNIMAMLTVTRSPIKVSEKGSEYSIFDKNIYSPAKQQISAQLLEVYQTSHSDFFEVKTNGEYIHLVSISDADEYKYTHGVVLLPFTESALIIPNYIWKTSRVMNGGVLSSHLGFVLDPDG